MAADHDHAVMMCCDTNYLPYALHLAWQIHTWSPDRSFDILIVSGSDLELPGWAVAAGIRQVTLAMDPDWARVDSDRFGPAVYLPLSAIAQLAPRYRRILALDSDIWFEGGDIGRLLRLDLGPHALGAARDIMYFFAPYNEHAREFRDRSMPAHPYFNSGVVVYDTAAYVAQDLERRFLDRGVTESGRMWLVDQTLMNVVLAGRFAEISPVWNWVSTAFLPLVSHRYPIRLRHFIGGQKPWRDAKRELDARFAAGYAEFFRVFLPDALPRIGDPEGDQLTFRELGNIALNYLKSRTKVDRTLSRFRDEWHVLY